MIKYFLCFLYVSVRASQPEDTDKPNAKFYNWAKICKFLKCKKNVQMFIDCASNMTTMFNIYANEIVRTLLESLKEHAIVEVKQKQHGIPVENIQIFL